MRNIASDFPAFIPIIASHRIASRRVAYCRLSSENCRNLDQSPCRNVQTGSRSNSSCQTDGRTYEISSLDSFSPSLSLSPLIMFNICLFFSARVNESSGSGQVLKKNHCDQARIHDLSSRELPSRRSGDRSNFARDPDEKARGAFYLQLMARSRI